MIRILHNSYLVSSSSSSQFSFICIVGVIAYLYNGYILYLLFHLISSVSFLFCSFGICSLEKRQAGGGLFFASGLLSPPFLLNFQLLFDLPFFSTFEFFLSFPASAFAAKHPPPFCQNTNPHPLRNTTTAARSAHCISSPCNLPPFPGCFSICCLSTTNLISFIEILGIKQDFFFRFP